MTDEPYTSDDATKLKRHALVGPAHLWQSKRDSQIRFLRSVGLKPHHYLLDLGCGTLRGGIPLIAYLEEAHYFGFDVRENVIHEARKELRECNLGQKSPTLCFHDSVLKFRPDQKFQYAWAYSVLIHLVDEVLDDVMETLSSLLATDGRFYANVLLGPSNKAEELTDLVQRNKGTGSCREFPLVIRPIEFYKETALQHGLALENLGTTDTLGFDPQVPAHKQHQMLSFHRV